MDTEAPITAVLGTLAGLAIWGALALATRPEPDPAAADAAPAGPTRAGATRGRDRAPWARIAATAAVAALVWALTGWPAATAGAAALTWFFPVIFGGEAAFQREQARVDAVASWAESLRDVIGAAAGLGQAIQRTAAHPPPAIADEVRHLAAELRAGRDMTSALRAFAIDLDDETADLVALALIGTETSSGAVAPVLDDLAQTARAEAVMRQRVHTGRARTRTATRVICGTTILMLAFLFVVSGDYLAPYDTLTGQLVLAMALGLFGLGLWGMHRLATPARLPRFITAELPDLSGVGSRLGRAFTPRLPAAEPPGAPS
ncbi:type II secretion system F family protein [Glycomyces sp. MUSA5-2]|uniref:type II secretion system F family protein n=1 Tax=Glycomyces sp. MUSA5-2 TaxID=2053002 RepID=UPI00300A75D9